MGALGLGVTAGLSAGLVAPAVDLALARRAGITAGDLLACCTVALLARALPRRADGVRGPGAWIVALAVAAAAVSASLVAAARISGRVTTGAPEGRLVAAMVVAGLVALGAVSFGAAARRLRGHGVTWGLLAASAASLATLPVLAGATSPEGFAALCARVGRVPSDFGTLPVDALLYATTLGLPALLLGGAMAGAARGLGLAALLAGAAAGAPLADALVDVDLTSLETATASRGTVASIPRASAIAGVACLVAALLLRRVESARASAAVGGGAALLLAASATVPVSPIHPRPGWSTFPVAPTADFDAPSGQYALLASGDGRMRVERDHARITPDGDEVELERSHIAEWAAANRPFERRVVVLGIATPSRARALAAAGIDAFDRTGVPPRIGRLLERQLFAASDGAPPPGDFVPTAARIDLAFRTGARELAGPGGLLAPGLEAPHAVRVDARSAGAPSRHGWALAGSDGLRGLWLARDGALPIRSGGAPSVHARLSVTARERTRAAQRALVARARPAEGGALLPLHRALTVFVREQRISSPFEAPDERVELSLKMLTALRDHVVARPVGSLSRLERDLVEGAADALVAQREVPWIYAILAPIEGAHRPWPRLVLALSAADEEELRPGDADARRESLPGPR